MCAAVTRSSEAVDVLLIAGANPNKVDSFGRTALSCALQSRDMTTVDKLCGHTTVGRKWAFQMIARERMNISGPLLKFIKESLWNTGSAMF